MRYAPSPAHPSIDAHTFDLPKGTRVTLMYDRTRSHGWPRRRSVVVETKGHDGWRAVWELVDPLRYDPSEDAPGALVLSSCRLEAANDVPPVLVEIKATAERLAVDEGTGRDKTPLPAMSIPTKQPPAKLLHQLGNTDVPLEAAAKVVFSKERENILPLWFLWPSPITSPPRRGNRSRPAVEWAELALLIATARKEWPTSTGRQANREYPAANYSEAWWRDTWAVLRSSGYVKESNDELTIMANGHLDAGTWADSDTQVERWRAIAAKHR